VNCFHGGSFSFDVRVATRPPPSNTMALTQKEVRSPTLTAEPRALEEARGLHCGLETETATRGWREGIGEGGRRTVMR
jgi:hypothetical protein